MEKITREQTLIWLKRFIEIDPSLRDLTKFLTAVANGQFDADDLAQEISDYNSMLKEQDYNPTCRDMLVAIGWL